MIFNIDKENNLFKVSCERAVFINCSIKLCCLFEYLEKKKRDDNYENILVSHLLMSW